MRRENASRRALALGRQIRALVRSGEFEVGLGRGYVGPVFDRGADGRLVRREGVCAGCALGAAARSASPGDFDVSGRVLYDRRKCSEALAAGGLCSMRESLDLEAGFEAFPRIWGVDGKIRSARYGNPFYKLGARLRRTAVRRG